MKQFFSQRWFLLALVGVLGLGFGMPEALAPLGRSQLLRDILVAVVMFLMSLPLEAKAIGRSIRSPGPALTAIGINQGLIPLLASAVVYATASILPTTFGNGILVVAATPCTIASAAVWTRRAGGNPAVAILVTLFTNLLCFAIAPCLLWAMIRRGTTTLEDPLAMARGLAWVVLMPLVLAQLARLYQPLARWANKNTTGLGVATQCGVLLMVLIGIVQSGQKWADGTEPDGYHWPSLAWMIALVLGIHLTALGAGYRLGSAIGFSRADNLAIAFAGSQKTLLIGLRMALELEFSILPMVAYHVGQLLVDTLIADAFRRENTMATAATSAPPGD